MVVFAVVVVVVVVVFVVIVVLFCFVLFLLLSAYRRNVMGKKWKPEGKRPLRRPRRRCEYNFGRDLKEICRKVVNWTHLTHDRDKWRVDISEVTNRHV